MAKSYFLELKAPLNHAMCILNKLRHFLDDKNVIDNEIDLFVNDAETIFFIFIMTENPHVIDYLKSEFDDYNIVDSTMSRYRKVAMNRMENRILEETKKYLLTKQTTSSNKTLTVRNQEINRRNASVSESIVP